jgi:hypothetical protein
MLGNKGGGRMTYEDMLDKARRAFRVGLLFLGWQWSGNAARCLWLKYKGVE